jgi:hypothetical protein
MQQDDGREDNQIIMGGQDDYVNLEEELSLDTIKEIETDDNNNNNSRSNTSKNLLAKEGRELPDFEYNSRVESVLNGLLPQQKMASPETIQVKQQRTH